MGHIKRRIQEGDPKDVCFCEDAEESYGSRIDWLRRRKLHSRRGFLMKPIPRGTLFTRVAPRCIMTKGSNSGRQE
jgi:hypothetical protein